MTDTLYAAAGGAPTLLALAEAWHRRALADPELEHPFSFGVRPDHTERLAAYLGEALGGPAVYTEGFGGSETEVVRLHSGQGVHESLDRRAIETFAEAIHEVGITDPQIKAGLLAYWTDAVCRMAEHPDTSDTVPDGLPVERWPWPAPSSD